MEIAGAKTTTDFLGQAIWRYHPETHRFEVFAEGGGNTFGVCFDEQGRVYSGTNWGKYRGLHYVQGGYYVKGWGKHGPLTNPYALGYFDHMPHSGNADRLAHTFIVYGGGALPGYEGKIIGVNSSATARAGDPPGAGSLHVPHRRGAVPGHDGRRTIPPRGRQGRPRRRAVRRRPLRAAHQPRRSARQLGPGHRPGLSRAAQRTPGRPRASIWASCTSRELVGLLASDNRWYRETALRVLGDRKDASVNGLLKSQLEREKGQRALESLWALNVCGGLDMDAAQAALKHGNADVRRWCAALAGRSQGRLGPSLPT